jgi:formylglycine-generating enzyme required for sulfatase activity
MGAALTQAQSWHLKRAEDLPGTDCSFIEQSIAQERKAQARARRVQMLVYVLLVGVIAGLIGWMNETRIIDAYRVHWTEARFAAANIQPLTADAERALRPDPKQSFWECIHADRDICPEMVVVPAGAFMMGSLSTDRDASESEFPRHRVTISKPFAVSKYALTFAEWDTCVAYGDCPPQGQGAGLDAGWGRQRRPVINVSFHDAQRYVSWLSRVTGKTYRLLTEAEYEYAARAGTQGAYAWGGDIGKNNANCNGCGSEWDGKRTAPVGSFAANQFGLFDMAGNVWEWTEDCYHESYDGDPPGDGSAWTAGDCSRRVGRGGSWYLPAVNLRSAARDRTSPDGRVDDLGFRVARTLMP